MGRYEKIVARRRALKLPGYLTLVDVGFDGPWVSPYQKSACSMMGPVLVAYNWIDAPSVEPNRAILQELGYLPSMPFNKVVDRALELAGMTRGDIYVTQAFHLLPETRSAHIAPSAVDVSFDQVTKLELSGRRVIALGTDASSACERHGVRHIAVAHPSARGRTYDDKARELAEAIGAIRPRRSILASIFGIGRHFG